MSQDPMPPQQPSPPAGPVSPVAPPITPAPPGVPHMARTSGLAAASLILGILGFLSCGLTGLIGMILGICALVSIGKSPGYLRGQGMAVAGMVLSAVSLLSLVFYGVMAAVVLPQFAVAAEDEALEAMSISSLQTVAALSELYRSVHGDAFPPARDWIDAISVNERSLAFPDDPHERRAFSMNIMLDGRTLGELSDAANTVLYFETEPGGPLAGGPELMPYQSRFFGGYLIVYANGDLGMIPPHELRSLIWEP